jgi:starch phosphorylase
MPWGLAAGGLGVLAGDHAKSASDLDLGFAGISLFYREGYFQQEINQENWQAEYYMLLNPKNLAIEPVLDAGGEPLVCMVEIAMTDVYFQTWRVNVGRCPVYLLDTNLAVALKMLRGMGYMRGAVAKVDGLVRELLICQSAYGRGRAS